jgi:hypothetical protein
VVTTRDLDDRLSRLEKLLVGRPAPDAATSS